MDPWVPPEGGRGWVSVCVPATSANIGPGFDAMGVALNLVDEVAAHLLPNHDDVVVDVRGEGEASVPRDGSHLVVRMIRQALEELGERPSGVGLVARNAIPHGRGLGSSAAAIVAGLALGHLLARPGEPLDRQWLADRASQVEGHPDNAAAAVYGGAVLAFTPPRGPGDATPRTIVDRLDVHPDIGFVVFVPDHEVPTAGARQVLPDLVPRADAVQQAIRSAMLVRALTAAPERLLVATEDFLHQRYRSALMPASWRLVGELRRRGLPAVISGAGPTVLALGPTALLGRLDDDLDDSVRGFRRLPLGLAEGLDVIVGGDDR